MSPTDSSPNLPDICKTMLVSKPYKIFNRLNWNFGVTLVSSDLWYYEK